MYCDNTPGTIIIDVEDANVIVIFCVTVDEVKVGLIGNVLKAVVSAEHKSTIDVEV